MLKRLIKALFKLAGYKIRAIGTDQSHIFFMFPVLKRCLDRAVQVQTVLDTGASDGRWTVSCMKLTPNASYLLIKAQNEHREVLEQLIHKHYNIEYQIAAPKVRCRKKCSKTISLELKIWQRLLSLYLIWICNFFRSFLLHYGSCYHSN